MFNRRQWIGLFAATGIGSSTFHRAATAIAIQEKGLTKEALTTAAWITDFDLSDGDAEKILKSVRRSARSLKQLRKIELDPFLAPAFQFQPLVDRSQPISPDRNLVVTNHNDSQLPESDEAIAFSSVSDLSHFIRSKQITSRRLTEIYLNRLKRFGPMLRCVVNLTEELAIEQAEQADKEITRGSIRGPLHGIPWGAKDLIDVPGYPTTWGIPVHKDRIPATAATVYERLQDAGAVLVAKLSLGAIAMGDKWFGGKTRNPWNPKTGSSGSSAGSAAATSAGLVGFSLGSETLGSITSPSKICGSTGFRPSFGRVSRHGCMPLSWTMDKIGPICRSALDCASVFIAIHGADGNDQMANDVAFDWPETVECKGLTIGYAKGLEIDSQPALKKLQDSGCELVGVSLPTSFPMYSLAGLIDVEAASVFDDLLRAGETDGWNTWTTSFRAAQYISAIDYLRYMRLRTRLMHEMQEFMSGVDFLVNVFDVFHTNLTGHPSIVFPMAYTDGDDGAKKPVSITITGRLDDDARLLAFANYFQREIGTRERPNLEYWLPMYNDGSLDTEPETDSRDLD